MLAERAGAGDYLSFENEPSRRRVRRGHIAVTAALAAATVAAWLAVVTTGGRGGAGSTVASSSLPRVSSFLLPSLDPRGPKVSLASVAGRPVILSFFASWCTGCQAELKTMGQVARSAPRGVEIIGIDVNDGDGAARALLASNHLSYPVGADRQGGVSSAFGLVGLPTTVFLDASHHAIGQVVGPLTPAAAGPWLRLMGGR